MPSTHVDRLITGLDAVEVVGVSDSFEEQINNYACLSAVGGRRSFRMRAVVEASTPSGPASVLQLLAFEVSLELNRFLSRVRPWCGGDEAC